MYVVGLVIMNCMVWLEFVYISIGNSAPSSAAVAGPVAQLLYQHSTEARAAWALKFLHALADKGQRVHDPAPNQLSRLLEYPHDPSCRLTVAIGE